MQVIFRLLEQAGFPKGVVNLVNGAKETVDAILDHPTVKAISFVGSSPVAKYVYARGAAAGKRVQAQGGAKNPVVILPTPTWRWPSRLRPTVPLAVRASVAWRPHWQSQWVKHAIRSPRPFATPPPAGWWAMGWMQASRWGR